MANNKTYSVFIGSTTTARQKSNVATIMDHKHLPMSTVNFYPQFRHQLKSIWKAVTNTPQLHRLTCQMCIPDRVIKTLDTVRYLDCWLRSIDTIPYLRSIFFLPELKYLVLRIPRGKNAEMIKELVKEVYTRAEPKECIVFLKFFDQRCEIICNQIIGERLLKERKYLEQEMKQRVELDELFYFSRTLDLEIFKDELSFITTTSDEEE